MKFGNTILKAVARIDLLFLYREASTSIVIVILPKKCPYCDTMSTYNIAVLNCHRFNFIVLTCSAIHSITHPNCITNLIEQFVLKCSIPENGNAVNALYKRSTKTSTLHSSVSSYTYKSLFMCT